MEAYGSKPQIQTAIDIIYILALDRAGYQVVNLALDRAGYPNWTESPPAAVCHSHNDDIMISDADVLHVFIVSVSCARPFFHRFDLGSWPT